MCRSELQSLKGVYPEFAESVAFFAVSVNPIDDTQTVAEFGERNGYPWPMAQPGEGMLESLRVTSHSTKVAFGPDGVIVPTEPGLERGMRPRLARAVQAASGRRKLAQLWRPDPS